MSDAEMDRAIELARELVRLDDARRRVLEEMARVLRGTPRHKTLSEIESEIAEAAPVPVQVQEPAATSRADGTQIVSPSSVKPPQRQNQDLLRRCAWTIVHDAGQGLTTSAILTALEASKVAVPGSDRTAQVVRLSGILGAKTGYEKGRELARVDGLWVEKSISVSVAGGSETKIAPARQERQGAPPSAPAPAPRQEAPPPPPAAPAKPRRVLRCKLNNCCKLFDAAVVSEHMDEVHNLHLNPRAASNYCESPNNVRDDAVLWKPRPRGRSYA